MQVHQARSLTEKAWRKKGEKNAYYFLILNFQKSKGHFVHCLHFTGRMKQTNPKLFVENSHLYSYNWIANF